MNKGLKPLVQQKLRQGCLILVAMSLFATGTLRAQSSTISEDEFWALLFGTQALIQATDENQDAALSRIQQMWLPVSAVRLSDGAVVSVDVLWLQEAQADDLDTLRQRVEALLDYRTAQLQGRVHVESALNALERILDDLRFQYPESTPIPVEEPRFEREPQPSGALSADLAQFLLIATGVIAVAAALGYIARGLRVRPVAVAPSEEHGGDPTTSEVAHELAASSETAHDYRSAIRYLYLVCLLRLDERGLIHYDPALTNREHLRQITNQPQLLQILRPVVQTFDRVWYGFAPVDDHLYREFRQHVESLQRFAR